MRKKYLIAGIVLALSLSMVGCGKNKKINIMSSSYTNVSG